MTATRGAAATATGAIAPAAGPAAKAEEGERAALLGARIRALRQGRGLTLVQLAGMTELSHPFLSQLERGLAQPSMGSLRRIAVALGTSPIELVAATEAVPCTARRPVQITRAGDDRGPVAGFAEGEARMLAHGERSFHPIDHRSANTEPGEIFAHAEDEFAFVLSGAVRVEVEGRVHALRESDSIFYVGGTPHRWWSADGRPFRLLIVKQRPA